MTKMPVSGYIAAGFEPVKEVFEETLEAGEELGASFCAEIDGEIIVDLIGGWADRAQAQPWTADTIVPVFSTTKPISALVLASVIGALPAGYETPVADIWPAFAAEGKESVTIGDTVSHQAGLSGFPHEIDTSLWFDPEACADALAAAPPIWEPGTAHGYHPISWGYLIGKIVRLIDGRSLGQILKEDFTAPFDIDFQIGLPEAEDSRIAELARPRQAPNLGELNDATKAAFLTKWSAPNRNDTRWRRIEIPSANGHGHARSVARLYSLFAHGGVMGRVTDGVMDGQRLIPQTSFDAMVQTRTSGQDLVLPSETEFAAGVMRNITGLYGPNPNTLCHSGWGGSMALGDPDRGLSAAYVMNRQSHFLQGDPRARRLVEALYGCL